MTLLDFQALRQWVSLKIIEGALGKAGRPPRACVGRAAVSDCAPVLASLSCIQGQNGLIGMTRDLPGLYMMRERWLC